MISVAENHAMLISDFSKFVDTKITENKKIRGYES